MTSESKCIACDLTSGKVDLPDGEVLRGESWVLEHCIGPLGVGTLVLKPLRHCTGLWGLTDAEAEELGPVTRLAVTMIKSLTGADQVFQCLWSFSGGEPGHIHCVLQPVVKEQRDRIGKSGPFIQTAMFEENVLPDPAAIRAFCDRAREWLSREQA